MSIANFLIMLNKGGCYLGDFSESFQGAVVFIIEHAGGKIERPHIYLSFSSRGVISHYQELCAVGGKDVRISVERTILHTPPPGLAIMPDKRNLFVG